MKKIINGKLYDTDTANLIGCQTHSHKGDLNWWSECLYRKTKGEFFFFCEGGAASKYAVKTGMNEYSGGCVFNPTDERTAKEWAKENLTAEDYVKYFQDT